MPKTPTSTVPEEKLKYFVCVIVCATQVKRYGIITRYMHALAGCGNVAVDCLLIYCSHCGVLLFFHDLDVYCFVDFLVLQ